MASLGFVSNTVWAVGKGAPCGPTGGIVGNLPLAMQRMAMGKGGVGKPEVASSLGNDRLGSGGGGPGGGFNFGKGHGGAQGVSDEVRGSGSLGGVVGSSW